MKKLSIVFACVSALALVGCKKKDGGTAAAGAATCAAVGANTAKLDPMMAPMVPGLIKACTDDKWATEVIKCSAEAKTKDAAKACSEKLTDTQKAGMMKVMTGGADPAKLLGDLGAAMGSALGGAMAGGAMGSGEPAATAVTADGSAAKPADGSAAAPADGSAAKPADGSAAAPADGSAAKPADGSAAGSAK